MFPNNLALDTALGTNKHDFDSLVSSAQFFGDRQSREQMPAAGAAGENVGRWFFHAKHPFEKPNNCKSRGRVWRMTQNGKRGNRAGHE